MSPKGPPFIFLIFCNRTNVKKFKRVSSFKFFGTMRLLKIRIVKKVSKWSPFNFLGLGKNFRLLMQSCCFFLFFFSRPFHENFKFLKSCPYDFHEILYSHSTPKGAPACTKASKSYGWDVRNIAKISPKMAKKQSFFDFFRFSHELFIRFERKRVRRKKT